VRANYDTSYRDAMKLLRHPGDRIAYGVLVLVLLALPWLLPEYFVQQVTYLVIMSVASLGLMVLTGFTGQVSLGHAAFLAIGAYAHALMLAHGVPFIVSLPLAGVAAGIAGLLIGVPAIRVTGLYLAMVTLAFGTVISQVIGRWKAVTNGYTGISVPDPSLFGVSLAESHRFYLLCLAVLAIVLLALINLGRSATGRAFVALRQSEAAAAGLGVWVSGYKVLAFVVSATVTGIAGGLLAHQLQFITPDGFTMLQSVELLLMVVIGGHSLRGAILGAALIGWLPTFISQVKPLLPDRVSHQFGIEIFVYGVVLAAFVLFEPLGIDGRWQKIKACLDAFPLYRRETRRRAKAYMVSERYR